MTKPRTQKRVKAWLVLAPEGSIVRGGAYRTHRTRIAAQHDAIYGDKVLPCTITYRLPRRKVGKR